MLFIYSSIDGHLGWFHLLATVNIAAINVEVRVPAFSSLEYIPRLLDYMVILCLLIFGGTYMRSQVSTLHSLFHLAFMVALGGKTTITPFSTTREWRQRALTCQFCSQPVAELGLRLTNSKTHAFEPCVIFAFFQKCGGLPHSDGRRTCLGLRERTFLNKRHPACRWAPRLDVSSFTPVLHRLGYSVMRL